MRITDEKGSILIVVILAAALISIVAIRIYASLGLESRRSVNIIDSDRAYYYALGAEALALQILTESFQKQKKEDEGKVHLGQSWAKKGMVFPIEGGQLAGEIRDMSACFNINSLLAKPKKIKPSGKAGELVPNNEPVQNQRTDKPLNGQALLETLLAQIIGENNISYDGASPKVLAAQVRDWLDADLEVFAGDGAEDSEYLTLDYPYRTGNTLMGSVEELRTLQDFTPKLVELVAPYLCALPDAEMSGLNINTIEKNQPELLFMLYKDMEIDDAREILASRPASGYDQSTFKDKLDKGMKLRTEATGLLQFDSDRFLINAEAVVGRGRSRLQSLVQRGNKGKFHVIARHFASDFGLRDNTSTNPTDKKVNR